MSIPIPSGMTRGQVTWRIGHDRAGSTLPGASGKVRFEPTARAVSYTDATVLLEPVETPVVGGVMTPVYLQVNDPAVWSWRVRPMVGVEWPAFVLDVPAGGVDVARVAVVEASVPTRLVTAEYLAGKVDDTDPRLTDARTPTAHTHPVSDVTGLTARLAALEYTSGERNLTGLLPAGTVVSGALHLIRTGTTCWLDFRDLVCTDPAGSWHSWSGLLPAGFRPPRSYVYMPLTTQLNSNATGPVRLDAAGGVVVYGITGQKRMTGLVSWPTLQAPPTTPPGAVV